MWVGRRRPWVDLEAFRRRVGCLEGRRLVLEGGERHHLGWEGRLLGLVEGKGEVFRRPGSVEGDRWTVVVFWKTNEKRDQKSQSSMQPVGRDISVMAFAAPDAA